MPADKKKIIKTTCLGADVYLLGMLGIGMLILAPYYVMQYMNSSYTSQEALWQGIASTLSVILASILLYRFALKQKDKGNLFTESESVKRAIFKKTRKITIPKILMFAAFIFFMQLIVEQVFNVMEMGLNGIGYTAKASTAATSDNGAAITTILYVALIGPITEEFVFRGFIMKSLKPYGKVFAICVSALMFSLMHADIFQLLFTLVAGVILGYVAMEYSIHASIILHIINNALFSLALGELESVNPMATKIIYIILFVLGAIVAIYFIYKDRDYAKEYISSNHAKKGTMKYLLNKWMIIYVVILVAQTIRSIKPL